MIEQRGVYQSINKSNTIKYNRVVQGNVIESVVKFDREQYSKLQHSMKIIVD